jgi:hypothetical protein
MEPSEKKEKSTVPRTNHGPLRSGLHIARFYELRRMHALVCGTLSATARQPTLLVPTTPTLPTTHPHPHPPHTRTHSLPGPRDGGSVWFSTVGPRAATATCPHSGVECACDMGHGVRVSQFWRVRHQVKSLVRIGTALHTPHLRAYPPPALRPAAVSHVKREC